LFKLCVSLCPLSVSRSVVDSVYTNCAAAVLVAAVVVMSYYTRSFDPLAKSRVAFNGLPKRQKFVFKLSWHHLVAVVLIAGCQTGKSIDWIVKNYIKYSFSSVPISCVFFGCMWVIIDSISFKTFSVMYSLLGYCKYFVNYLGGLIKKCLYGYFHFNITFLLFFFYFIETF